MGTDFTAVGRSSNLGSVSKLYQRAAVLSSRRFVNPVPEFSTPFWKIDNWQWFCLYITRINWYQRIHETFQFRSMLSQTWFHRRRFEFVWQRLSHQRLSTKYRGIYFQPFPWCSDINILVCELIRCCSVRTNTSSHFWNISFSGP